MARKAKSNGNGTENAPIGSDEQSEPIVGTVQQDNIIAGDVNENTPTNGDVRPEIPFQFAPEQPKKKRGRPAGSGYKTAKSETVDLNSKRKPTAKGISNLSGLYLFANNTVAASRKAPEFVINDNEAQIIANPLAEVLAEWGIHLDGGENPYLRLFGALTSVYALKTFSYAARRKAEASESKKDENPFPFQARPTPDAAHKSGMVDFSTDKPFN